MYKTNWIYLILATVLFLPGCVIDVDVDDDDFNNCLAGQGSTVVADFDLDEFSGIKLEIDAEVFVTQGNNQSVSIEAEQNIIDEMELDIRNDNWTIEFDDCVRRHDDIRIFITIPDLRLLSISGSGLIRGENIFDVDDLKLKISGSGDIDIAVDADKIDAEITGSGKMLLEGLTNDFDFEISGSGDFRAFNLESLKGDIEVFGSGDSEVRVLDFLDIEINGSGDVYYKGFPALDVEINGSGLVIWWVWVVGLVFRPKY